jgi:acetyltransferase-like isoleucine patch superfamily enzyme
MGVISKTYEQVAGELFRRAMALAGVRIGEGLRIRGLPLLRPISDGGIVLGRKCRLYSGDLLDLSPVTHRVILANNAPGARIVLGDDVRLSGTYMMCRREIRVGSHVNIGPNAYIVDNDGHPLDPDRRRADDPDVASAAVIIGDDVFIGANATILKGVEIGDGAVIGAGAVLVSSVPARCIAAGNPAKVIGKVGNQAG